MAGQMPNLISFGDNGTFTVTSDLIENARCFITSLYGKKSIQSLDLLREHVFANNKGDIRSLPPTEDSFKFHLLRALYQFTIFKQANKSKLILPDITLFGRTVLNNRLVPIRMSKPAKPTAIKPCFCKCSKTLCSKSCSCAKAGASCIAACACFGQRGKCARLEVNSEIDEPSDGE